ncbi:MAG TPA: extracellular solute-binding protein [Candidatus Dormibacteraeota bacterium]|nr:extracellular solute-binding protein [Candidatus Dormibacteraeota bacterium]
MKSRNLAGGVIALVPMMVLAACGSSATAGPTARTLNVWLMNGSAPAPVIDALNSEFQAAHAGVTVKVDIQQWSGITDKTNTALSSQSPPDVLEMGNTLVSGFASAGGLADLSGKASTLGSSTWLQSLKEAGTLDGKLYGVPYYAGDRVVIYNKDMFTAAGITSPPTTRDELVTDGQKLMAKNSTVPGFSGLYLPGKDWYAVFSWLFDGGGTIATKSNGKWAGALESSQAQSALSWVKDMRTKVGTAPGDGDETKDDPTFEAGKAAMVIEAGWHVGVITKDKPDLTNHLGVFPIPGASASAPVFLGGSNLGVGSKSKNQDLAVEYIKLLAGSKYQTQLAVQGGVIPNSTSLLNLHSSDPFLSVADTAAAHSWFVPNSPNWGSVESSNIPQDMLAKIFTGRASVADATKAADQAIADKLNQ